MKDFNMLLRNEGLDRFETELSAVVRPAIRIQTNEIREEAIPVGASKIGGRPDLPKGISWPYFSVSMPYSFIGQINMADIEETKRYLLPKTGMLYFFLTSDNLFSMTGDYYNEQNARVFYVNEAIDLERADFPHNLNPNWIYKACEIKYCYEPNMPPAEYSVVKSLGISLEAKELFKKYCNFSEAFLEKHNFTANFITKLMGYPDQIQGDLQIQCDDKFPLDWILLFQVDSDYEKTHMMWGDYGRLYFMIKQQDLIEGFFENCFVIYQC
ncbi:YwqG family protein [Paenibacillus harenae]|uniref:YwqG family protein n=1 Tax=Paenibacillus harenae TaxID=306543 RepID=UPI0004249A70|nr:YwqG family protein [Paenibacillus harenae]